MGVYCETGGGTRRRLRTGRDTRRSWRTRRAGLWRQAPRRAQCERASESAAQNRRANECLLTSHGCESAAVSHAPHRSCPFVHPCPGPRLPPVSGCWTRSMPWPPWTTGARTRHSCERSQAETPTGCPARTCHPVRRLRGGSRQESGRGSGSVSVSARRPLTEDEEPRR